MFDRFTSVSFILRIKKKILSNLVGLVVCLYCIDLTVSH